MLPGKFAVACLVRADYVVKLAKCSRKELLKIGSIQQVECTGCGRIMAEIERHEADGWWGIGVEEIGTGVFDISDDQSRALQLLLQRVLIHPILCTPEQIRAVPIILWFR